MHDCTVENKLLQVAMWTLRLYDFNIKSFYPKQQWNFSDTLLAFIFFLASKDFSWNCNIELIFWKFINVAISRNFKIQITWSLAILAFISFSSASKDCFLMFHSFFSWAKVSWSLRISSNFWFCLYRPPDKVAFSRISDNSVLMLYEIKGI